MKMMRFSSILVILLVIGCAGQEYRHQEETRSTQAAEINVQLGVNYMGKGDLELASIKLERALQQDPNLASAHWTYALLQMRLKQDALAEKHFRKAIALDPEDSMAHTNYGVFLCKHKRLQAADEQFLKALDNPLYKFPETAYTAAGQCIQRVPNEEKAEAYFRAALEENPHYPAALYQMAKLGVQQERWLQARAYLQRYSAVATQNAKTLWLGVQTERALGNLDAAASYALQLKNLYPQSEETALLLESERGAPLNIN